MSNVTTSGDVDKWAFSTEGKTVTHSFMTVLDIDDVSRRCHVCRWNSGDTSFHLFTKDAVGGHNTKLVFSPGGLALLFNAVSEAVSNMDGWPVSTEKDVRRD